MSLSSPYLSFLNGSITLIHAPEIFKPGSTVLENQEKAKTWIPDKNFSGTDEKGSV